MSRLAPAAPALVNSGNTSTVIVNVSPSGGVSTRAAGAGGLTEKDAREIGRVVSSMVDQRIAKQQRSGGALYQPKAG